MSALPFSIAGTRAKLGVLTAIVDALLALFFPPECPLCGRELGRDPGPRLCRACARRLERAERGCPRCGVPGPAAPCRRCALHPPPFRIARAVLVYRDGNEVAHVVQRWKYHRDEVMGRALTALFRDALASVAPGTWDWVVPVPSDPVRLRRRGFSPALALARALPDRLGSVAPGLLERRAGASQVGLGQKEREANTGAFAVAPGARIAGSRVLLVDDVFTTGATVVGCAAALRAARAAFVDVWTLAHTAPPGAARREALAEHAPTATSVRAPDRSAGSRDG